VDLLVVVALFALQALLVAPLFTGEFTRYRGSIEAAYITDARFIVDHFPDLSWNPFWYLGFPFEWFYTPLLPGVVAILGKLIGDVPAAYRLVAATGYALGPAALYVATREIARSRGAAVFAALAFVFVPSVSYLLPGLQADGSAFSGAALPPPWRLIALVEYGEGPHVLSLSLALLALAAGVRYIRAPSGTRLLIAVVAMVVVALTNLIGVLGAAVFLALVPASERIGEVELKGATRGSSSWALSPVSCRWAGTASGSSVRCWVSRHPAAAKVAPRISGCRWSSLRHSPGSRGWTADCPRDLLSRSAGSLSSGRSSSRGNSPASRSHRSRSGTRSSSMPPPRSHSALRPHGSFADRTHFAQVRSAALRTSRSQRS
jgi:hypothetical protein